MGSVTFLFLYFLTCTFLSVIFINILFIFFYGISMVISVTNLFLKIIVLVVC